MKSLFRKILSIFVFFPFLIRFLFISTRRGRGHAIEKIGPQITKTAAYSLRYFVPNFTKPADFDDFAPKMRKKSWLWKPFYDYKIIQVDADTVRLHVYNCPFCEVFDLFRLPELKKYLCQGDWEYAKRNQFLWKFSRKHEIGKGDNFCDHTYSRIKPEHDVNC